MLNAMKLETIVSIGRHQNTAETFVVLRGDIRVKFFDDDKNITVEEILDSMKGTYGVCISKEQGR